MSNKVHPIGFDIGRFICNVGLGAFCSILIISTLTSFASASYEKEPSRNNFLASALQGTSTPTATLQPIIQPTQTVQANLQNNSTFTTTLQEIDFTPTYSFSLDTLGYEEIALNSPYGQAEYAFTVPQNWTFETDGILELDLSYVYDQISNIEEYPIIFGDLTVRVDGQTLDIFTIEAEKLDHFRLRVPLLSSLWTTARRRHTLELIFDTGIICRVPHQAKIVIHPTSSIYLNHSEVPLDLNLSLYPRPFYQNAFDPDIVHFVLPSQPSSEDLMNAAAVAAKLGDLTSNQTVISATTDLEFSDLLATSSPISKDHFIIIGQPQDNRLISLLNDTAELPVSLHQNQLEFVTQGPTAVAPSDTFTYIFTVTNTIDEDVELSLVNSLPFSTELVDCTPDCVEDSDNNVVTWNSNRLAPAEMTSFSLTLEATDILTGKKAIENTITLIDSDLGPLNANTLTSTIVTDSSDHELQFSVVREGDYFFVYEGQAVAKEDGIVQEFLSPWDDNKAILILTGLSNEAVRKASQAMSSETRFPGMTGPVALVQDILSPLEINNFAPATEFTFADIGYLDRTITGQGLSSLNYFFDIPYGWQLTKDAGVDIYFTHSQLVDYEDSIISVILGQQPVASIALNDKTAVNGHIHLDLADKIRSSPDIRLRIETDMSLPDEECADLGSNRAWLHVQNHSKFFLPHNKSDNFDFNLNDFPHPFNQNSALTDLIIALPDTPTIEEWETVLSLAARLGNSAAGKTILPVVTMGDTRAEELANYHVIAIGQPSRNALIREVNPQLPQPFLPGSDQIEQRLDDIVFRLPPGTSLGYLQLIPSPWDGKRAFLAITGTTIESVRWSASIPTYQPWLLNDGNLALVRSNRTVNTIDTRQLTKSSAAVAVATAVSEMTPVAMEEATSTISPTSSAGSASETQATEQIEYPGWLIFLVGATGLTVIGIFAFVFWQARRRNSS